MNQALKLCLAACLFLASNWSGTVWAHAQKAAITRVVFNERTHKLEVMHRFNLHDAEHAVGELGLGPADILGSEETRQKFAAYVIERFSVMTGNREPVLLDHIGQELEGEFLWIYQEAELPQSRTFEVVHAALQDIWPAQVNMVNFEFGDQIRTIIFDGTQETLSVEN